MADGGSAQVSFVNGGVWIKSNNIGIRRIHLKIEQNRDTLQEQERIFGQMHFIQNEDGSNPSFAVHELNTLLNLIK
jgi:hypothetical protein